MTEQNDHPLISLFFDLLESLRDRKQGLFGQFLSIIEQRNKQTFEINRLMISKGLMPQFAEPAACEPKHEIPGVA